MKATIFILLLSLIGLMPDENQSSDYTYQLVVFEGSDWCVNCRRLEKNVLSEPSVVKFLEKEKIELVRVDFPQRQKLSKKQEKKNEQIAEKYKFTGKYPELVLVKKGEKIYRKILGDNLSVLEFMSQILLEIESL